MDEEWAERKRRQDIDDLNNEAAGREVGRISRFHPDRDPEVLNHKKREQEARMSALMRLMRDAEYAAAYQGAWDSLNNAQPALDEALIDNAADTEQLEESLREMEARAARLPDGREMFRGADGSLRTADGQRLRGDELPASLAIPANAPSYEDYAAMRDALIAARQRGDHLARIQTEVIDPARDRLNDEDNPPSKGELDGIRDRLDRVPDMIASQRMHDDLSGPSADSAEREPEADTILSLDELGPAP